MINRSQIEALVRAKLTDAIQTKTGNRKENNNTSGENKPFDFVNQEVINSCKGVKSIAILPGAIITPAARDSADQLGITLKVVMNQFVPERSSLEKCSPQTIAIGADHGGFPLKEELITQLKKWGYEVIDVGTHSTDSVDYPDFAYAVACMVAQNHCKRGIMIDGAGIGSAMVANKVRGIRAAHCHNLFEINNSREHNDANVLTLGGKVIGSALATEMVKQWLKIPFAGGRHQKRIDKMMQTEKRN